MARYVEALERHRGGRLSCIEAAEVLGISERHFRRLRDRYEAEGAEGLIDRRRGTRPRGGGRGSDHDNGDRAAAGEVRSALNRTTRDPRRAEFLILNLCSYNTRAAWKCQLGC